MRKATNHIQHPQQIVAQLVTCAELPLDRHMDMLGQNRLGNTQIFEHIEHAVTPCHIRKN